MFSMVNYEIPTAGEVNAMSDSDVKVLENRLRRAAERQGLRLEKSRSRDPRALTYGTYRVVDNATDSIAAGGTTNGYGLGLDEVAEYLFGESK